MLEEAVVVIDQGKEELHPREPARAVAVLPDFGVRELATENTPRDVCYFDALFPPRKDRTFVEYSPTTQVKISVLS